MEKADGKYKVRRQFRSHMAIHLQVRTAEWRYCGWIGVARAQATVLGLGGGLVELRRGRILSQAVELDAPPRADSGKSGGWCIVGLCRLLQPPAERLVGL